MKSNEKKRVLKTYDPKNIEAKWQKFWLEKKTFFSNEKAKGKKKFVLVEFPYPSGAGLHMGHMRPFIAGDVTSKYFKLNGFNTMYPMGWDAFGLPAENYAIKNKVHPSVSTVKNVSNAKKQLASWGTGFDWGREINTTDPEYYKWTQKLFLEFFKAGLAYEKFGEINWCPKDKTGLANEEVVDGKCERCGETVEKKNLRQWYLKITDYAEKLLLGLKNLPEWPESVKLQQENWIGKSEGSEIEFKIKDSVEKIKVFTTRADTLFGVTYLVLAPEHPLLSILNIQNKKEIEEYIESCKKKSDEERTNDKKEKTGVEIKGLKAINPANGEEVPVWVADYVLGNYGTGAVMAVPAHDERDFEFAKKYNLNIRHVVANTRFSVTNYDTNNWNEKANNIFNKSISPDANCYINEGILVNSSKFDGLSSEMARKEIVKFVGGKIVTKYKLRDWVFSRQRYWGEPIPLIHCDKCGIVPVSEKDLPVKLPSVKNYEPTGTGESPLATIDKWVNTKCPKCRGKAKRETNTMPQWAGSSWYWLRYMDPKNKKEFASLKNQKYWSPVDLYFGGMEHTTLHLLYSRFWNLVFKDRKLVTVSEPYKKRVPHGIILGPDGEKMSKSRGNVVNPDDIIKIYGADTVRLYMMFLGPHGAQVAWNDKGIVGARRFIERVFSLQNIISKKEPIEVTSTLHKTIKKVGEDIESFSFNTAVSAMMIFVNTVFEHKSITEKSLLLFIKVLSPFAPHVCEELWQNLNQKGSVFSSTWPKFDAKLLKSDTIPLVVQINGKFVKQIDLPTGLTDEDIVKSVKTDEKVAKLIEKKLIKKVVVVKDKIVNFVV